MCYELLSEIDKVLHRLSWSYGTTDNKETQQKITDQISQLKDYSKSLSEHFEAHSSVMKKAAAIRKDISTLESDITKYISEIG